MDICKQKTQKISHFVYTIVYFTWIMFTLHTASYVILFMCINFLYPTWSNDLIIAYIHTASHTLPVHNKESTLHFKPLLPYTLGIISSPKFSLTCITVHYPYFSQYLCEKLSMYILCIILMDCILLVTYWHRQLKSSAYKEGLRFSKHPRKMWMCNSC